MTKTTKRKVKEINGKPIWICEYCGHYWNPLPNDETTCALCGSGGKVEMFSEDDLRRELRKQNK